MAQDPDKRTYGGFRTAYEYRKWVGGAQFSSKASAIPKLLADAVTNQGTDNKSTAKKLQEAYTAYLRESEKRTERILGGMYSAFSKVEQGLKGQLNVVQKKIQDSVKYVEREQLIRKRIGEVKEAEKKKALQFSIFTKKEAHLLAAELSTLLVRSSKSDADKKNIEQLVRRTQELLLLARSGKTDKNARDDFEALQHAVNELKDTLSKTDQKTVEMLDDLAARYESEQEKYAREWREVKDAVKTYVKDGLSSMRKMAWDASVSLADKLGVGPFTVGNAFRAGRSAYRGTVAAGRAIGRGVRAVGRGAQTVGRAGKWIYNAASARYRDERAQASALSQSTAFLNNADSQRRLEEIMNAHDPDQRMVITPKQYKKEPQSDPKLLEGILNKLASRFQGPDAKEKKKAFLEFAKKHFRQLSDIKKAASGISGAISRAILGIGAAIAPVLLPIVGVVSALAAGWAAGNALYEKYSTKILDGIDWVMDNVRSLGKWVSEKWEAVSDFFGGAKDKVKGAWQATKEKVSSVASAATGTASSVVTGGAQAISSAYSSTKGAVSDVIEKGAETLGNARAVTTNLIEAGANKASEAKQAVGDWWKNAFKAKDASVNMDGLQPGLKDRLASLGEDYKRATGKTIQVNSAYRSPQEQKQLYDAEMAKPEGARKAVARPGSSLHNFGYAIDVNSQDANRMDSLGLLAKYGLERPVRGEPWHLQPKGVSAAAAMKGIYSADYTKDQGSDNATQTSAAKTAAAPSTFNAPRPVQDTQTPVDGPATSDAKQGGGGMTGTPMKSSVGSIPTFSTNDGTLLAMNMGAIG